MQATRELFLPSDLVGPHLLPPNHLPPHYPGRYFREDISGVTTCMIHSGLAFILTIYCMHLLYALYGQRKKQREYERLDIKQKGSRCDLGSGKNYQSFV